MASYIGRKKEDGFDCFRKSVARKETNDLIQGVEEHLRKGRAFALRSEYALM